MYIVMLWREVNLILIMSFALAAFCVQMHVWMFLFLVLFFHKWKSSLSSSAFFVTLWISIGMWFDWNARVNKVINCMLIISFSSPLPLYYSKALKTGRNKNINDNVFSIFVSLLSSSSSSFFFFELHISW